MRPVGSAIEILRNYISLVLLGVLGTADLARADFTVARIWDEQLLHAISIDTARPTVHARNLFHLSAAMYDAWAAYDATAAQYLHHEKVSALDVVAARNEAVSFAAYNIILHRFVTGPAGVGPGRNETLIDIRQQMLDLGYDPNFTSTVGDSPAALGNRIAQMAISHGLADGADESNKYTNPPGFEPVNPPLTFENSGTTMNDPNRWQELHFLGNRIDQFGRPINEATQVHLTPFWGEVTPFAMTAADRSPNGVYHDQGMPPGLNDRPNESQFKADALTLIRLSAQLDPNDGVMIDISPATRGNTPNAPFTNSYDQVGYAENPSTNLPYQPEMVKQGDFGRVMAEFWADGPKSETPPGHWNVLANFVSDELAPDLRIGGSGEPVDRLQWDVKLYLSLNGAVHDAAIAAWGLKGYYDSVRPISMIRYMGGLGQSSDPTAAAYDPEGLPLAPGLVEVISPETTAPGGRHAALAGHEGEVAIRAWAGNPADPRNDVGGVSWILAVDWVPYQLPTFVTPAFQGYISGHSTFSRAAAEVMTAFTGSEYFPGGASGYTITAGSLKFEKGPSTDIRLEWATYYDASDQAGQSRLWGGIHIEADDFAGRVLGSQCGKEAWALAERYFAGTATP